MDEISIKCNKVSPQGEFGKYNISIENNFDEKLLYKFLVGIEGTWKTLQDFEYKASIDWEPDNKGYHIIMVQAKYEDSNKSFDYMGKLNFDVGNEEKKFIRDVSFNKSTYKVGDKVVIKIEPTRLNLMYRYWVWEDMNWKILREYSVNNELAFAVTRAGNKKILIQCKEVDSQMEFDDFREIEFNVENIKAVEITDFRCVSKDLLVNNELNFQVEAEYEQSRMVLYKFIKINEDGSSRCIQDFSTKRLVSYIEKNSGKYRLLCLVKDMYSTKEFDDRAVINYEVKPYKDVYIKNFTTDSLSPQIIGTEIKLKSIAEGGRELLYRYIINGASNLDTGYIKSDYYIWKPQSSGEYSIELRVKDRESKKSYEDRANINFIIDEFSAENPVIDEIIPYNKNILKGQQTKFEAIVSGGIDPKYSFILYYNDEQLEITEYSDDKFFTYTPEKSGEYKLEGRVKDKYCQKEFDSSSVTYFKALEFIPVSIDYILNEPKEYYMMGDKINFELICSNTKEALTKYIIKVDGHTIEESPYEKNKKYEFKPRFSGVYTFEFYAKNINSEDAFDSKRSVNITVRESFPITNTKIICDKKEFLCSEAVNLSVQCDGGKDILYEFYLMENEEWILTQKYSRKDYYSFIPFKEGCYKILVLVKSMHKKVAYEDFCIFSLNALSQVVGK